jgi:WD40 repeat protein
MEFARVARLALDEGGGQVGCGRRRGAARDARFQRLPKEKEVLIACQLVIPQRRATVAGCSDGALVLWSPKNDYSSGASVRRWQKHAGRITCVVFSEDLSPGLVATGSADHSIRLWHLWDDELENPCIQTLLGHGGTVTGLACAKGRLVSSSVDGTVRVWEAASNRGPLLYPWFSVAQTIRCCGDAWINTMCLRDGESLALFVGDSRGFLHRLVPPKLPEPGVFFEPAGPPAKVHALGITRIAVVPQQSFVVTLSNDMTVRVHDILTLGGVFAAVNCNNVRFTVSAWSPTRQELLLADEVGEIQVWSVLGNKCTRRCCVSDAPISDMALRARSSDDAASASVDRLVLATGQRVETWEIRRVDKYSEIPAHRGPVIDMALAPLPSLRSPDAPTLHMFTASQDGVVRCWDLFDMSCVSACRVEGGGEISCLAYDAGATRLLCGFESGELRVVDFESGEGERFERTHTAAIVAMLPIVQSAAAARFLTASFDGVVSVWDTTPHGKAPPQSVFSLRLAAGEVQCAAYYEQRQTVFAGTAEGDILVHDLDSRESCGRLRGHGGGVNKLAIDGNVLLSCSDDGSVRVWDCFSQLALCVIQPPGEPPARLSGLTLVPDSALLVLTSEAGEVQLWDFVRGALLHSVEHKGEGRAVCLLSKGSGEQQVAVGTATGAVLLVTLAAPEWHRAALADAAQQLAEQGPAEAQPTTRRATRASPAGVY